MKYFKQALFYLVGFSAVIGLAFGFDVLVNGACNVDRIFGLDVPECHMEKTDAAL